MSDSDHERKKQRQHRRRSHSVRNNKPDDTLESNRYTKLLEKRLQAAELLPTEGQPIIAKQLRHINNYQHAIPFRQQFIEQILHEFKYIDREIEADLRKQAEQKDKEAARILRQVEKTHQKKVRELELYNNHDLVRKLVAEHLQNSTSKAQLRRIHQLEENFRKLRQEHDELVESVNKNKREHDDEINEIKQRFDDYRIEIDEYRQKLTKTIAELQVKLESLLKKQESLHEIQQEHGTSIKDLSLQRETLNKLSQQIEQIINIHRSDLEKLDKFSKRLDNIRDLINQIREGLHPLNQIPSLEQEIIGIRNLIIQPSKFQELELRVKQTEDDIIRHTDDLESLNEKLNTFYSTYEELKDRINDIKTNNISIIQQHLELIDNDLKEKSVQITETDKIAQQVVNDINELKQYLTNINEKLINLENIKLRLDNLEAKPDDPRIVQILEEQNRVRVYLEDLANKQQQLIDLANDLENLKRLVNDLNRPIITNNEPIQHDTQNDFENDLQNVKKEILNLREYLNGQIDEAKILINSLKTQLEQLLNAPKKEPEPPSIIQQNIPSKLKLIPFIESLPPIDLLQDIWK